MAASNQSPLILSMGEPLLEFNQVPEQAEHYRQGFGGDTSNFCIAAARQGARVGYVTRVGTDEFGSRLIALWEEERVAVDGVQVDDEAHTGIYFVTHHDGGHEFTYFRKGSAASRLAPDNLPLELLATADYLHLSGITQAISSSASDAVFAAIEYLQGSKTVISYDPNLRLRLWPKARAKAIVEATLPAVHYFMPSLEDAVVLTGLDEPEAIADYYLAKGARNVVLKLGGDGVLVANGQDQQRVVGHQVSVKDTTGAGDCFDGSFIARLAAGDSVMDAVRYANAAAALSTTGFGAVAPIPQPAGVRGLLASA